MQVSRKMGGIAESVASGSEGVVQRLVSASQATTKTIEVRIPLIVAPPCNCTLAGLLSDWPLFATV